MKKLILTIALITAGVSSPAYQGDVNLKQNDGSAFTGNIKGDEWFNWVEDKDGNIIKYNRESKDYEYGQIADINGTIDLVPSGIKVLTENNSSSVNAPTAPGVAPAIPTVDRDILSEIWKQKTKKAKRHNK